MVPHARRVGARSLGLYEADFVPQLLHASHAHRSFVHWASVGTCWAYGNARNAGVYGGIWLLLGDRMWPVWHWLTLPYLFMWSWGVVLVVILPPILQRVVFGRRLPVVHARLPLHVPAVRDKHWARVTRVHTQPLGRDDADLAARPLQRPIERAICA
ncbi:uncharacterized protein KRP23_12667 [Phytophthora ramorum]|uniref:uncharacterized protein n=1 Tax=Phytophthora ramorum TaxID=164328 RepID=UPI0030AAA302|nr:hypothetical protein KRP23_12667 [Phytophthora ramorum]